MKNRIKEGLLPSQGFGLFWETLVKDINHVCETYKEHPNDFKFLFEDPKYNFLKEKQRKAVSKLYEKLYDKYVEEMMGPFLMKNEKADFIGGWIKKLEKNKGNFQKLMEIV